MLFCHIVFAFGVLKGEIEHVVPLQQVGTLGGAGPLSRAAHIPAFAKDVDWDEFLVEGGTKIGKNSEKSQNSKKVTGKPGKSKTRKTTQNLKNLENCSTFGKLLYTNSEKKLGKILRTTPQ